MIVERRRWMTAEEFNDAYSLCNFLPGPNIVNFSVEVSIGLLGAGAILLARVADHNWIALAVTAGTAAIAYGSRLTPLWMFALGGCSGLLG
jgi:chromate transport protein ChrA